MVVSEKLYPINVLFSILKSDECSFGRLSVNEKKYNENVIIFILFDHTRSRLYPGVSLETLISRIGTRLAL